MTATPDLSGRRVLLTGASGFLGRHLAAAFGRCRAEVIGITRRASADPVPGESARILGSVLDREFLERTVARTAPHVVVHTAGAVEPARDAATLFDVNVLGTERLMRAVRTYAGPAPTVIITSSGAFYGAARSLPIDEDGPPAPLTAYAASKVAQEMVALQHELNGGPNVVRARLFSLGGPNQPTSLVLSHLASRVVAAERGENAAIPIGNVEPRRDFVDVRDAAAAIVALAATPGLSGPFNICSGRSRSIAECAELLAGYARVPVTFETVPERRRQHDVSEQVGTYARLQAATGWTPRIPLEQTLQDMLADWRAR